MAALLVLLVTALGVIGFRTLWPTTSFLQEEPIDVYDGFEGATLSPLWDTGRFATGAVAMQSDFVRAGHGAARITLRARDTFESGKNGSFDSERDELVEARRLFSREGRSYEFSWSMYVPVDFPIVPVRLVVAQWKQECPRGMACDDDNPVLAVRYVRGILSITQELSHKRIVLFRDTRDLRGRWLDLRFQVRFTPQPSGYVKAWLDGTQVVDHTGVTANPENSATGYRNPSLFYFKMGLYRDAMARPMTIYLDEYRKRELGGSQPAS